MAKYTVLGVDVSIWNGDMDWESCRISGAQWAIIKISDGIKVDIRADDNIQGARQHQFPFGGYHYARYARPVEAQVETFLSRRCLEFAIEPSLDVEKDVEAVTTNQQKAKFVVDFCAAMDLRLQQRYGTGTDKKTIIYTAAGFWDPIAPFIPQSFYYGRKLWVANYTKGTFPLLPKGWPPGKFEFWQYSKDDNDGALFGCKGNDDIDKNWFYGTASQFEAEYGPLAPEIKLDPSVIRYKMLANAMNIREKPNATSRIVGGVRWKDVILVDDMTYSGSATWVHIKDKGWLQGFTQYKTNIQKTSALI